jgi:hypothetical protein
VGWGGVGYTAKSILLSLRPPSLQDDLRSTFHEIKTFERRIRISAEMGYLPSLCLPPFLLCFFRLYF